jgi:hypothetical protein
VVKLRLEYVQAYYPKELANNITRLRTFAAWKHLDCQDITSEKIRQRLIELKQEGIKRAYINKHLVVLRSVLQLQFVDGLPQEPMPRREDAPGPPIFRVNSGKISSRTR